MSDREPSEVKVKVLDLEQFLVNCSKQLEYKVTTYYQIGVVRTSEGSFFFNNEGVGDTEPITEENPYEICLYKQTSDSIAMFPSIITNIYEDMEGLPWKEELVPLHEFIRSFGTRLESNYKSWKRFLEATK